MTDQKTLMFESRPPLPPFTHDTAIQKVRLAEDGWNSRDPEKVASAYTVSLEKPVRIRYGQTGDR
jgi:nuclear transport factor 2 (NTF2) superfamily protein